MKYNKICSILKANNYWYTSMYDIMTQNQHICVKIDSDHSFCHIIWYINDDSDEVRMETIGFCEYITIDRIIDTLKELAT